MTDRFHCAASSASVSVSKTSPFSYFQVTQLPLGDTAATMGAASLMKRGQIDRGPLVPLGDITETMGIAMLRMGSLIISGLSLAREMLLDVESNGSKTESFSP
jgi:hypothetical protein